MESTKKRRDCKKSKSVVISQGTSDLSLHSGGSGVMTRDPLLHHELRSLMLEDCLHILRKGGRTHAYVRI